MKKFEQELTSLKQRVIDMGTIAETMVARASQALVSRDATLIGQVREAEDTLDRCQIEIDGEAVRLITIYTPTAKDLRFLLMVVRINTELERIGDQAVNNCEYAEMFLSEPPPRSLKDLSTMADITVDMVRGALQAFAQEDVERAEQVLKLDDAVDTLNALTFADLVSEHTSDPEAVKRSMSLILLARSLERIADHATNICEEVVYLVKGEDIRHQSPAGG
jgi:phosphate transport system protein